VSIKLKKTSEDGYQFRCPACNTTHSCDKRWEWNGDLEKPTFLGSVLVYKVFTPASQSFDGQDHLIQARCHSQITDGMIYFYSDCEHAMTGLTVELPDW
jgi:hypothetical protein